MKTQLIGILTVTLLSGCANLSVKTFDKPDYSLVKNNRSDVVLTRGKDKELPGDKHLLKGYVSENEELENVIDNNCLNIDEVPPKEYSSTVVAFAAPLGKLVFNWYMDKKVEQIEELKQAAQAEYSNRIITDPGEFNNASCAIIYRYDEKKKDDKPVTFVSVLKLQKHDDKAFTMKPIYVKAHNTVAITKSPDEGETAKIDTSFTVSLKAIKTNPATRLPVLSRIGEGVVELANVDVAPEEEKGKASCLNGCESSDLIALPDKGDAVSVTFVTNETGKIDIDLDKKAERLKALKEALGPVLESELQKLVKEEE